jgi:hypothetical protein
MNIKEAIRNPRVRELIETIWNPEEVSWFDRSDS